MNYQSNYYPVTYQTTAPKICHDPDHQEVDEQHIR